MTDAELRQLYKRVVSGSTGTGRAACVAPEALLALVEDRAGETDRFEALRHVATCGACKADLDLLRSAATAARGLRRRNGPALTAAAAIVVLACTGILWRARLGSPPVRSEPLRGAPVGVLLVGPSGEVAPDLPVRLTWHALPRAVRYDVEVVDARGRVLFSVATHDTAAEVPHGTSLAPGADYYWWVRAHLADGTMPWSRAQRFRMHRR